MARHNGAEFSLTVTDLAAGSLDFGPLSKRRGRKDTRYQLCDLMQLVWLRQERNQVLTIKCGYHGTHARGENHRNCAIVITDPDSEGKPTHRPRQLHVAEYEVNSST